MTMHLIRGVYCSQSKRTSSLSTTQYQQYVKQWKQYNKEMRQQYMHSSQFGTVEEYIDYCHGKLPAKKKTTKKPTSWKPAPSYRRETAADSAPSARLLPDSPSERTAQQYTGTLLTGLAVMHKSNIVPVFDKNQAIEIATMRRN
jgi:hypothetical protein